MRQYNNPSQSGTMMSSQRGKEPLDNVIDRVMQIAQRVVGAENVIKNQASEIARLKEQVVNLEKKIENIALKASGKEFKKPETTTSRTRKTTKPTETTES